MRRGDSRTGLESSGLLREAWRAAVTGGYSRLWHGLRITCRSLVIFEVQIVTGWKWRWNGYAGSHWIMRGDRPVIDELPARPFGQLMP
jgi:hypothetical protein